MNNSHSSWFYQLCMSAYLGLIFVLETIECHHDNFKIKNIRSYEMDRSKFQNEYIHYYLIMLSDFNIKIM